MTRIAWVVLALAISQLAWVSTAFAQKRVALVIGNSAYQHTSKLANPKNDAADVAAALKALGFQVVDGFDLDKSGFDRKVREFAAALEGAGVGLFFYAGHGLSVAGQNYLVPVDAQLTTSAALEFEMLRVDVVHRIMERLTSTNILFLDACWDNPLGRNLAQSLGTRSADIGKGLVAVEAGVGSLISFSTHPGAVALDGRGRNSPFAGALVKHLLASREDLSGILIAVRNDVMKDTERRQVPWEHSALTGRFYFNSGGPTMELGKAVPSMLDEAGNAWVLVKEATSPTALEAFIARFGDTFQGELAKARLAELRKDARAKEAATAWSLVKDSTDWDVLQSFISRFGDTPYSEPAKARVDALKATARCYGNQPNWTKLPFPCNSPYASNKRFPER